MPKHVLVVEDEPDTAELIELHLKNDGYRVTVAGDGDQALKKSTNTCQTLLYWI